LTLFRALHASDGDAPRAELFEQVLVHTAGNPLLLRLAASRLEQPTHLPPALFGAQLASRLVDTLLTWLSPSARRVLDLLTVARTFVNLDDASLVTLLRRCEPDYDHTGAVNQLLRGHLVEHRVYAGLHPLLRDPLLADLEARPADRRLVHQVAAAWATGRRDFITAAHHDVQAGDLTAACSLLADEWVEHLPVGQVQAAVAVIDEVVAAIRRTLPATAHRSQVGLLLARRGDLLIDTPRAAEARVDYRTAMEATDELLPRMQLAYRLANSLLQVGQARDALQLCTDAAEQLAALHDTAAVRIRAQLDGASTRALIAIGHLEDAALRCRQAIEAARSLRLANPMLAEKICTDAYRGLGYIARRQGRNTDARPFFVRAVSHARSAGLHKEEAETLGYLSATLRELGDFAGALQYGEQALVVAQNAGNDYLAANLLHHLSITCYYHARLAQALAYSQQAALLHQAMGDSEGMVSCDILQAVVYAALGSLSSAVAAIDRAHSDSQLFDNGWLQGMALYVYGIVHTFAGNLAAAEAGLSKALTLSAFVQDAPMAASARLFLGINSVAQGKLAQAQAMARDLPSPSAIEVELLAGLFRGMVQLASGDFAAALVVAEETRRRSEASGHLIYAAESVRLSLACATPVPLADLPAFVCCEIRNGSPRS
jgi:tetratricopeptide (TPR) repeat protein